MTTTRTYTEDEAITLVVAARYGPHDIAGDEVLMAYVDHNARHADWDTRVQTFARLVAETARRRREARANLMADR